MPLFRLPPFFLRLIVWKFKIFSLIVAGLLTDNHLFASFRAASRSASCTCPRGYSSTCLRSTSRSGCRTGENFILPLEMIGPSAAILSFFSTKNWCYCLYFGPISLWKLSLENIGPHSLSLGATSVATTPLALFVSGFLGSLVMSPLTKVVGRKVKEKTNLCCQKIPLDGGADPVSSWTFLSLSIWLAFPFSMFLFDYGLLLLLYCPSPKFLVSFQMIIPLKWILMRSTSQADEFIFQICRNVNFHLIQSMFVNDQRQ